MLKQKTKVPIPPAVKTTGILGTYLLNYEDTIIIDPIIDSKRVLKPWDLVRETHGEGGAWDFVYKDGLGDHQMIPKQLIQTRG
jgi:hypothetical protein